MRFSNGDAEDEVFTRAVEDRRPLWTAEAKAWAKAYNAGYCPPPSIYDRFGLFFEARAASWNYGPIYLNANLVRGEAVAPSYTRRQERQDAEAEQVDR